MTTVKNRKWSLGMALLLASSISWAAFPTTAHLANTPLQLNGQGVRYRLVFKVYDMALYTPKAATSAEQLLDMPGPKRLSFVALRELPGTDLGMAFMKGLSANSPKDQVAKYTVAVNRLIEIFSAKTKLPPGATFAMDFVPGRGTAFYIDGQPQGAPVGDDEFFQMILRIWVGQSPADHLLRDQLLGKSAVRAER